MYFDGPSQVEKLRTVRHRENKRRYRARQREYVESLQQRLADTRDQQVAGMREVQLAAQKVVKENVRLRSLLRLKGVNDAVVESWLNGNEAPARVPGVGDTAFPQSQISRTEPLSIVSLKCQDYVVILTNMDTRFPQKQLKHVPIYNSYRCLLVTLLAERLKSPLPYHPTRIQFQLAILKARRTDQTHRFEKHLR